MCMKSKTYEYLEKYDRAFLEDVVANNESFPNKPSKSCKNLSTDKG